MESAHPMDRAVVCRGIRKRVLQGLSICKARHSCFIYSMLVVQVNFMTRLRNELRDQQRMSN